ncbi:MAG: hypothetical protein ABI838_04545 [Chloroflexota bacterium]
MGLRNWLFGVETVRDPGPQRPRASAAVSPAPLDLDPITGPWSAALADLERMASEALGNRSRKAIEQLRAAPPTREGVYQAVDALEEVSILFVDSSRLSELAAEMRQRLAEV